MIFIHRLLEAMLIEYRRNNPQHTKCFFVRRRGPIQEETPAKLA